MPSAIQFVTGTREQLDASQIINGAVYFIPNENGTGDIAYDFKNQRTWVANPKVIREEQLSTTEIPRLGEFIVVPNAYKTVQYINGTSVETNTPALKVGNGQTSQKNLPYIGDNNTINIEILEGRVDDLEHEFAALETTVNNYIPQGDILINETNIIAKGIKEVNDNTLIIDDISFEGIMLNNI